jgi:hypothetical protein
VVSFTPRPLYSRGTHYIRGSVDSWTSLKNKKRWKFFTVPGFELQPFGRRTRSQSLYRISHHGSLWREGVALNPTWTEIFLFRRSRLLYDWQSVSMSWYRATLWDLRPNIISCRNVTVWNLRSCICGTPSLTRGRVCNLQCNHLIVGVTQNP